MALTTTELEDMKDALETAKFSGALSVTFRDRTIQYRSMAEIDTALADIERKLGTRSTSLADRQITGYSDKDL